MFPLHVMPVKTRPVGRWSDCPHCAIQAALAENAENANLLPFRMKFGKCGREDAENANVRVGFWQFENGFSSDFYFGPPDFFADFLSLDFFSSFLWGKIPRKILQENPRQKPLQNLYNKKSQTHFCRGYEPRNDWPYND